jgi:hypothetical protein
MSPAGEDTVDENTEIENPEKFIANGIFTTDGGKDTPERVE